MARVAAEADDASEVMYLQLTLPADQVLTEASAKRHRNITDATTANQLSQLPPNA